MILGILPLNKKFDKYPSNLSVTMKRGVATLVCKAKNAEEKKLAIKYAKEISGLTGATNHVTIE